MQPSNPFNWPGLDDRKGAQESLEAMKLARLERVKPIADAFQTPLGKKALAELRKTYLEQPVAVISNHAESAAQYAFYREGQNSVVRAIEQCIEIARNEFNSSKA